MNRIELKTSNNFSYTIKRIKGIPRMPTALALIRRELNDREIYSLGYLTHGTKNYTWHQELIPLYEKIFHLI